jgi:hypothetical protein
MENYLFNPSKKLDSYLYSVFLNYASADELEQDILFTTTHWQILKYFNDSCEEYTVWFVDGVAVTKQPERVDAKIMSSSIRRYINIKNPNDPYNKAIIQPNIEAY